MRKEPNMDRYFYIIGWLAIGAALIALGIVPVAEEHFGLLIPHCLFHAVTGYYCPGCGGTRAVRALLHGQLVRSLYYHPFVGYVAVVGGWFMISQTIEYLSKGRARIALHFRQVYMWIGIFLIIANCLVKNLVKLVWGISLMS